MNAGLIDLPSFSPQILEFIEKHPHLPPLLEEAVDRITHYFGDEIRVEPQLVTKNKPDDGVQQLFLNIIVRMGATEAFLKLQAFDNGWWLDNSGRAEGSLEFDVEFAESSASV